MELLNAQRKLRPSSPHFTIYEPQLSWLTSIANRATGTGLSVGTLVCVFFYMLMDITDGSPALPSILVPRDHFFPFGNGTYNGPNILTLPIAHPHISKYSIRIYCDYYIIGIYALAITYVAAPLAGLHFDSSSIISLISSLPMWAKLSAKTIVGAPFWFHTWNGMRHLSWDMGYRESQVIHSPAAESAGSHGA